MNGVTYLFFGKPGPGKTTTAQIVANTLNGKIFGTDNIRAELYSLYPDLKDFEGLEGDEAWYAVSDWILSQDSDSTNLIFTLTPVFGYEPPEDLKQLATLWAETRSEQSSTVYQEILKRAQNYFSQPQTRRVQDSLNRLAILDGTYGLPKASAGRLEVVQTLSRYGPVYAVEVFCSEKKAKDHINARNKGIVDPGHTLARKDWIWDITTIEPLTEKEDFTSAIHYNTDTQEIERIFGIPDSDLWQTLERLSDKIKQGKDPRELIRV